CATVPPGWTRWPICGVGRLRRPTIQAARQGTSGDRGTIPTTLVPHPTMKISVMENSVVFTPSVDSVNRVRALRRTPVLSWVAWYEQGLVVVTTGSGGSAGRDDIP